MNPAVKAILPWVVWPTDVEHVIGVQPGHYNVIIFDDRKGEQLEILMQAQRYENVSPDELAYFTRFEPAASVGAQWQEFATGAWPDEVRRLQWIMVKRTAV